MSNNAKNGEINFADILVKGKGLVNYLFSKCLVIFFFCGIAAIGGITYAWLEKPIYTSELVFSAESNGENKIGSYAGIAAQFGLDLGGSGGSVFQGDNLTELLKMRTIVQKTLFSKDPANPNQLMIEAYVTNHRMNIKWKDDTSLSKINFTLNNTQNIRIRDSIINKVYDRIIKKQLVIEKKDKKLSFITASMKDENESFSKNFIELLATNAIEYFVSYRVKKSKANVDILQQQTDSVRGVLFGGITSVAQTSDLNINPNRQIVRSQNQKKQVDVQAATAVYSELLKNLELSKINLMKETPLIQIIDYPVMPLKKEKLGRLLTGIICSAVAFVFIIFYLSIRRWIKLGFKKHHASTQQNVVTV